VVEAWASGAGFGEARQDVAAAERVLRDLGSPRFVVSSANGTWIDRVEAAALRHVAGEAPASKSRAVVSSIYGYVAETFSTCPLAALAAVLLTGRLPALFGPGPGLGNGCAAGPIGASGTEGRATPFGVLCTDYAGLVSGCRIALCERVGC